jgi:putative transposase
MTFSLLYQAVCRVLQLIRLAGRSDTDLAIEVVMLGHEVAVPRRQVHRPALEPADRAVLAGLARLLPRHRPGRFFVQPATLLRWHRDLLATPWAYPHGRPGRPAIAKGTTALILRPAKETPAWGYRRIHGGLATIGVVIAPLWVPRMPSIGCELDFGSWSRPRRVSGDDFLVPLPRVFAACFS